MSVRLLLIDNYDSFTYNLVQAFRTLGAHVDVWRNDKITVSEARELAPTHRVISPGPGEPLAAGECIAMINAFAGQVPILGVCLGHQAICAAFGGEIVRAARQMHGKVSFIEHDGQGVFAALTNPLEVGRYHSLIAAPPALPEVLQITARSDSDEIMGVRHRTLPIEGVQFHPESVLTPEGNNLLNNFIQQAAP